MVKELKYNMLQVIYFKEITMTFSTMSQDGDEVGRNGRDRNQHGDAQQCIFHSDFTFIP